MVGEDLASWDSRQQRSVAEVGAFVGAAGFREGIVVELGFIVDWKKREGIHYDRGTALVFTGLIEMSFGSGHGVRRVAS